MRVNWRPEYVLESPLGFTARFGACENIAGIYWCCAGVADEGIAAEQTETGKGEGLSKTIAIFQHDQEGMCPLPLEQSLM